ncbi:MAG: amidohydrolase family protein [Alphaproteobacteria bacterium]|nr:amidohydrolase family protein [Alphaproteobacteria bacterium]
MDKDATEIYIPNKFVHDAVDKHKNLFFGASINPLKKGAIEELDWAVENGAKLIKWLPNVMLFDPSDERIIPFYEKMAEFDIPLLCHTGHEKCFSKSINEFADPMKLDLPLEVGVRVIAAHCASSGKNEGEDNFKRLEYMVEKHDNLYGDISGLTQINKRQYMKPVLDNEKAASAAINLLKEKCPKLGR